MSLLVTPAVVLATFRYGETSKIVRLATEEAGVQSAIAKGALRPRSRFGAALQVLSDGHAHLIIHPRRELQLLTAFDLQRVRVALAADMRRYAAAASLAELMIRFASTDRQPGVFQRFRSALDELEQADPSSVDVMAIQGHWALVSALGFTPELYSCVRDGRPIPAGELAFSFQDGGALCASCAGTVSPARLGPADRADLVQLVEEASGLPALSLPQVRAHQRLLARYITHHLAEDRELPALGFWLGRSWEAA